MVRKLILIPLFSVSFCAIVFSQEISASRSTIDDQKIVALIRCDDVGMCHAVNTAIESIAKSGIPFSASVMVVSPWFDEAVDILREYPRVSAGIHLALNSEWKHYRWGPVTGPESVPSLVDSSGYFLPSNAALLANNPKLEEIERELSAQISRAKHSGLKFDYVDFHMGIADIPGLRAIVEKLAHENGLGISRYFGEQDVFGVYSAPIQSKTDTLVQRVQALQPGPIHLFVCHTGMETPEMDALVDMNPFGLQEMSKHRNAERKALLSAEFQTELTKKGVKLTTYRELIEQAGLEKMKRPE